MFRTTMLGGLLLAAAAAGPYLLSNGQELLGSFGRSAANGDAGKPASEMPAAAAEDSDAVAGIPGGKLPDLEGPPVGDLAEVLRFDVSSGWVLARWPHVAAGMANVQYQGYRVPLVTGTASNDLAGSLTYYFNARQEVERIAFRGTTGDPRKLIALMMNQYHFARRLTNDPGVFLYEAAGSDRKVHSRLMLRSAGVIRAEDRYRRFEVDLTISRPT